MQYLHIALKRKWLILSIVLGVVALGLLKAVLATPRYTAVVRIQIDREPLKLLDRGMTAPQEEGGTDFLKTQFELLKSRAMAERVVSSLKLRDDGGFLANSRKSWFGSALGYVTGPAHKLSAQDLQSLAVNLIGLNVDVRPVAGSALWM